MRHLQNVYFIQSLRAYRQAVQRAWQLYSIEVTWILILLFWVLGISHFLEYIIDIIKSGINNNEFRNVDPRITALSILINIEGIHWFTLFDKSGVKAHEYIDTISNFILNGLKKKS